jgi:hypothetical protein
MLLHQMWDGRKRTKKNYLQGAAFNLAALFAIILIIVTPLEPAFATVANRH